MVTGHVFNMQIGDCKLAQWLFLNKLADSDSCRKAMDVRVFDRHWRDILAMIEKLWSSARNKRRHETVLEVDKAEVVAGEALLAALDHVEDAVDGARRRLVVAQDHVHVEDGDVLRRVRNRIFEVASWMDNIGTFICTRRRHVLEVLRDPVSALAVANWYYRLVHQPSSLSPKKPQKVAV